MIEEKLVSVIIPNYNCSKFIKDTIYSVLEQNYKKLEIIVIDDCSTDNSLEILKKINNDKIKIISLSKNSGAAICRNKGIEIAKGEYIAFLDSDDLWDRDKLERQISFMEKNKYSFTFTEYIQVDEKNNEIGVSIRTPRKITYNKLLYHDYIGCLTAIYNQKELGKIYSENLRNNNDYSLFLNILKKSKIGYGLKEKLARYRIRKNSISRKKIKTLKSHFFLLHSIEKQNFLKSIICIFSHFLIKKIYKEVREK